MSVIILPRNQNFGTAEIHIKTNQTETKSSICVFLFYLKNYIYNKNKTSINLMCPGSFQNLDQERSNQKKLKSKCS